MKRTFIAVFSLVVLSVLTIGINGNENAYADDHDCSCATTPVTIIACFPVACPGLEPPDTRVSLYDETCGQFVGSCLIPQGSQCCTLTVDACSSHKFSVKYQQGGPVCSTPVFIPSGNPHTVTIGCYCP